MMIRIGLKGAVGHAGKGEFFPVYIGAGDTKHNLVALFKDETDACKFVDSSNDPLWVSLVTINGTFRSLSRKIDALESAERLVAEVAERKTGEDRSKSNG